MISPLVERLHRDYDYPLLDAENYHAFVYGHELVVLFFTNNPVQFPESNDVVVVLPELLKAWQKPVQAAVIGAGIEHELQRQFRFNRWPALVFLQRGGYLGAITGIRNWQDFLSEGNQILNSPATEPPPFDFDRICNSGR